MLFFQLFTTLPLYHNEKIWQTISKWTFIVVERTFDYFLLEMPIVSISQEKALINSKSFFGIFINVD
jgi:hypothetical protein